MAFGTVVKSISNVHAVSGSMCMNGSGRLVGPSNSAVIPIVATGGSNAFCALIGSLPALGARAHQELGHRNLYVYDVIGAGTITRTGLKTSNCRPTGGLQNGSSSVNGRRVFGGNGVLYDHVSRARLRDAPTTGLTTPTAWTALGRYLYITHNTNQLVKMHRTTERIVASCTLPANAASTDGLWHNGRNIIFGVAASDTIYWLEDA